MISKKQIFVPVMGISCNSNCIMCSVSAKKKDNNSGTTQQIIDGLINSHENGYQRVDFTGGEPTARKDINILIKKAKELGYHDIGISTNGILLSDKEFLDKLIKSGLNTITFALHAHSPKLHKLISRTPTAFTKEIKAIKYATKYNNLIVAAATVILRQNHKYLFKLGNFIHSLGIHYWNITDLIPYGRGQTNYNNLFISRIQLSKTLSSIKPLLSKFNSISLFAMTPCVIPRDILYDKNILLFTTKQKIDLLEDIFYKRLDDNENHKKNYLPQKQLPICQQCKFRLQCDGVWIKYLRLKGSTVNTEIFRLAKKFNYLIK